MDTSNSYFLLKNLSGSHLHIICIHSFPGALPDKLYSLIIVHIYVNNFFFHLYSLEWLMETCIYSVKLLLWQTCFSEMTSLVASGAFNIFTCVRYNYNHEIRKSTSFWLVPFGDGVFLLVTEAGISGTSSLKTSTSLKILVGFSWKGKDMKHDKLRKLGISTEIIILNSNFNFCSNSLSLYNCMSGTYCGGNLWIVLCLGYI